MGQMRGLSKATSSGRSSRSSRGASRRCGIMRRRPGAASIAWNSTPRTRPTTSSRRSTKAKTARRSTAVSRNADLVEQTEPISEILRKRHQAKLETVWRGLTLTGAPPCFNHACCHDRAVVEKRGRSLCRNCANSMNGHEYPLREPTSAALYASGFDCAQATDMLELQFIGATVATFSPIDQRRSVPAARALD
jgi:hypothetical protein